jgi:hypothetical protein
MIVMDLSNSSKPINSVRIHAGFFKLATVVIAVFFLSSCISYTSFGTARMLDKNKVEIIPYVSQSRFAVISNDPQYSPVDVNSTYGIALGYGMSNRLNFSGNVERINFGSSSGLYGFRIGVKKAIRPDREAVSFSLGYYNLSLFRICANGYSNFYITRKIYYCFDPAVNCLIYLGRPVNKSAFNVSANIFNNMTFELDSHFYLRPEVSFDVFSALRGVFWFNYGIAGGFVF